MIFHNKFGENKEKIIVGIHGWGGTNKTFLPIEEMVDDQFTMIRINTNPLLLVLF